MQTQKAKRTQAQSRSIRSPRRRRALPVQPAILESPPVASPVTPVAPAPTPAPAVPPDPGVAFKRVESTGEELFEPRHWLKLLAQWAQTAIHQQLFRGGSS
jgi:hypothetical protein